MTKVLQDHLDKGGEQKPAAKTIGYKGKKYKWVSPATFTGEEHEIARDCFGVTKAQIMSLNRLREPNTELEEHDFNATSCGAYIAVRRKNPDIDVDEFKRDHEPITVITELMTQLTPDEITAIQEITGSRNKAAEDESDDPQKKTKSDLNQTTKNRAQTA